LPDRFRRGRVQWEGEPLEYTSNGLGVEGSEFRVWSLGLGRSRRMSRASSPDAWFAAQGEGLYRKRVSISKLLAMMFTARMLYYY
jgi:hypothetical protein